jgi:hypothetical protein
MDDTSAIDIICRQTDYSKEIAERKLRDFDNDYTKVIKDFMGIKPKKEPTCAYVSQQRYKIIRTELDNACKNYREKKEKEQTDMLTIKH